MFIYKKEGLGVETLDFRWQASEKAHMSAT